MRPPTRLQVTALALWTATACSPAVSLRAQAPATFHLEPGGWEQGVVTEVIDGDTIEVRVDEIVAGPGAGDVRVGRSYNVRLLGIDTPESVHPREPVECFGRESSAATKALLLGETVRMLADVEDADHYDRLLRYVYVGAEMANARLVTNGYAAAYTYPPNVRHADLFIGLQREARLNERGLWAPATCNGNP